jgi:hypothetical protein
MISPRTYCTECLWKPLVDQRRTGTSITTTLAVPFAKKNGTLRP